MIDRPKVFLSYCHQDLESVQNLYTELKKREVDIWFDKINMRGGLWKEQIERAIWRSQYFLLCISEYAIERFEEEQSSVQELELIEAYQIAKRVTENELTIIPVRLEECRRGRSQIAQFHQYDFFGDRKEDETNRLAKNIGGKSLSHAHQTTPLDPIKKRNEELLNQATAKFYASDYEGSLRAMEIVEGFSGFTSHLDWYNKAVTLKKLGRLPEALIAYEKSIELKNDDKRTWMCMGRCLKDLKRHTEAIDAFNKSISLDKGYEAAYLNKVSLQLEVEDYKSAKTDLEELLEITPKSPILWNNYGVVLENLKLFNEALISYRNAAELDSNESIYISNVGFLLVKLEKWKEALPVFNQLLKLDPTNDTFWVEKAKVLVKLGKETEAEKAYEKAEYWMS